MALSVHSRNIHKHLVSKSARHFSEKGYTIIKEARMDGKTRIDVLALKGAEKIGIECQINISSDIIRQKFRDYGRNLTKMIFVVPVCKEAKIRNILSKISQDDKFQKNFFDVWTEDVDEMTTIRLTKKGKKMIDEIAKEIGLFGETYDDVISRVIDHYSKCSKVRIKKTVNTK